MTLTRTPNQERAVQEAKRLEMAHLGHSANEAFRCA